jgi:hypothetical protein
MAYYIQIQITLLLLFSNSLVLAQLDGNKTIPYLNKRAVISSRLCVTLNTPDSGSRWALARARCSSINTFTVYCINLAIPVWRTYREQILEDLPCPSPDDICVNILAPPSVSPSRLNMRIRMQDIICISMRKDTLFRNDGTIGAAATCSMPIAAEIGIEKTWQGIFTHPISSTSGDTVYNAITVSMASVQNNLIGGQPTNSWTSIKTVQEIMDLQWLYTFQQVGEQIRVCFISGAVGVVFATIRSGTLVEAG